jgi:poly(3-hydroxybutyrate) depolymerase
MHNRFAIPVLSLLLSLVVAAPVPAPAAAAADWRALLPGLLAAAPGSPAARSQLEAVMAAQPDCGQLADALRRWSPGDLPAGTALNGDPAQGQLYSEQYLCSDGVARPYVVYIPPGYGPERPAPLLVVLHGGVGHAGLRDDPPGYAAKSPFLDLARQTHSLALYPFGQTGCTWWDSVGMGMIRGELHAVRQRFNVDDNRIAMCGFSDGASAGFLHAMLRPDAYSAFVCLNGHMGVGSLDGGLPTYATNLASRPVYAVTTFSDPLYPSAALRPTIDMARAAGADITYHELPGVHEFSYAAAETPLLARWLAVHPRNPQPRRLAWEAATPEFGRCDWLEITGIAPTEAAPWHTDHNCVLVDTALSFGFQNDDNFAGPGVKVGSVVPDSTAQRMGLLPGDVITATPAGPVDTMDGFMSYRNGLQRGDSVGLTVRRNGAAVQLSGQLPPPESYFLFKRDKPSAAVQASFAANHFELRGSRLGRLRLWLDLDMVDFSQPVTVSLDGREVYRGLVQPEPRLLLEQFMARRDRGALYAAKLDFDLGAARP